MKNKLFLLFLILTVSLINGCNFLSNDDPYNLSYQLESGMINLSWNTIEGSNSYLINVYEDGLQVYSNWVSDTKFSIEDDFSGSEITFMVAASGEDFSKELKFLKKLDVKPMIYNPYGVVEQGPIAFSWSKPKNADYFYFELYNQSNSLVEEFNIDSGETTTSLKRLQPGEYRWRVTPFTETHLKGTPSNWTYITVSENSLKVNNVFGIEKDSKTPFLSTSLTYPESAVYGSDKAIYVSDTHSNVIRKCVDGICENVIGTLIAGKNTESDPKKFMVNQPGGITFDKSGNLIFSDVNNGRVCKVDKITNEISVLWNHGKWAKNVYVESDGSLTILTNTGKILNNKKGQLFKSYQFAAPVAMAKEENKTIIIDAVDAVDGLNGEGNELLFFTNDTLTKKIKLSSFSSGLYINDGDIFLGEHTTVYKLNWNLEKEIFSTDYANITNITSGKTGELLITDSDSGGVYNLDLQTRQKTLVVGAEQSLGAVSEIEKLGGFLYFLDNQASIVWKYNPENGETERFIGNGKKELATIGANRLETGLFYPTGLTSDSDGNFYIAEQHHIIKITSEGNVELFAGPPGRGTYGFKDGKASEALFQSIRGIDFDSKTQSLYVADTYNNRIRKVHSGVVTTIAGDGVTGEPVFGKKAIDSHLTKPHDIIVVKNELIISDSWNNTVSKIDKNGNLQQIAGKVKYTGYQGNGSFSGDNGKSIDATLNTPHNLFYDNGILYIVDTFNNRIRTVSDGKIKTLIGSNSKGYDPNNYMVLNFPSAIYLDDKYIYIADVGNYLVRRYLKSEILLENM